MDIAQSKQCRGIETVEGIDFIPDLSAGFDPTCVRCILEFRVLHAVLSTVISNMKG